MSDNTDFSKILLKTVFTFMVCDGDISPAEIDYIKDTVSKDTLFGDIDIDFEINEMIDLVNLKGVDYLEDYFKKIKHANLSEQQELTLLKSAIQTIESDNLIKQDEINFLRILRTVIKVSDEKITEAFPKLAPDFISKDGLTDAYIR